jgi:hypothetical protein
LVRDLKDALKDDQNLHDDKCGDPPLPQPPPIEPVCEKTVSAYSSQQGMQ